MREIQGPIVKPVDKPVPRRIGLKLAFVLAAAAAVAFPLWRGKVASQDRDRQPISTTEAPPFFLPDAVEINHDEKVFEPFRGKVHPVLHGQTSLAVTAHWSPVSQGGRDQIENRVAPEIYREFTELKAAIPEKVYTERELSSFLMPDSVQSVGQVWELDEDDVAEMLLQFHPRPSLHVVSRGRRAGPDGAFALLRAVSATHLEIMFRIHAEFDIAKNVWLTPACFWGRMIVDKQAGTVEYFRLWLPTENYLNVHLTVRESVSGVVDNKRDIVHVEQMELESANRKLPDELDWSQSIDMAAAEHQLKKVFYRFENIHWIPWDRALAVAAVEHKPILAIVLWGALDDQSC